MSPRSCAVRAGESSNYSGVGIDLLDVAGQQTIGQPVGLLITPQRLLGRVLSRP
jgi:hypothetical protein